MLIKMRGKSEVRSVLSLFSGCGGLDIPFSTSKYEIVGAYDNDPAAIKCLIHNLKCPAKILDVMSSEFETELSRFDTVDVVLGGFPCQGFSKSGPKSANDPRNKLYLAMISAVEKLQPTVFVAENVDGLVQNFEGSFVEKIIQDFAEIGYRIEYRILNAINYGVAQYRRRIIFIGVKANNTQPILWPKPTHSGDARNGEFKTMWDITPQLNLFETYDLKRYRTIAQAIGDLLELDAQVADHTHTGGISQKDTLIMGRIGEGQKLCNVRFSDSSIYTWDIPEVFGDVSQRDIQILEIIGTNRRKKIYGHIPNGNPLAQEVINQLLPFEVRSEELLSLVDRGYLKLVDGKFDLKGAMFCSGLYKRPKWGEPSPTVLTVFDNPRYFFHPKKNRPFTIRECARLQSFPDNFEFLSSGIGEKDAYRLIGNAVPPLLAKVIEETVSSLVHSPVFA